MTDEILRQALAADIDQLRTPAGYLNAGLPNYDHLFGRDACVSALQLLDYDPTIARNTLQVLAFWQGDRERLRREEYPGKILHEHFPGGWRAMAQAFWHDSDKLRKLFIFLCWRFPYYGTIDAGAWWLILAHAYFQKTTDRALLEELWPHTRRIMSWLEHHAARNATGLVAFRRHYLLGLRNQSWKDNLVIRIAPSIAMVEVQGYYYRAYMSTAELAQRVMDDGDFGAELQQRAATLRASFSKLFWDEETRFFSMAIDARGQRIRTVSSNPGHLLFSGILESDRAAAVVERLFAADMWTPYGLRTESVTAPTFDFKSYHHGSVWPFDNWVIYEGLRQTGYDGEAERIKTGLYKAHRELGAIPELYGVTVGANELTPLSSACRVQAWSAGALLNMLDR